MSLRFLTDRYIYEGKMPPRMIKKIIKERKKQKKKMEQLNNKAIDNFTLGTTINPLVKTNSLYSFTSNGMSNTHIGIMHPVDTQSLLNFSERLLFHALSKFPHSVDVYILSLLFFRMFRNTGDPNYNFNLNQSNKKSGTSSQTVLQQTPNYSNNTNYSRYNTELSLGSQKQKETTQYTPIWKSHTKSLLKMYEFMRSVKMNQPSIHQRWIVFCIMHQMQNRSGNNEDKIEDLRRELVVKQTEMHLIQIAHDAGSGQMKDILDYQRKYQFIQSKQSQGAPNRKQSPGPLFNIV
ncbi:MAG: hypothetical protein EZS28_044867 [Streblomastix strix]|uniref:Uncharacterized protein n=1 Tax=Streblomastix strix TaxID=222440 RepID=A0A5J4TM66_9EUKA|nr:MAG: hypothetical protein EZS28_044867 [Streblomastix strix]